MLKTHKNVDAPSTQQKSMLGRVNNPPPKNDDIMAGKIINKMNGAKIAWWAEKKVKIQQQN